MNLKYKRGLAVGAILSVLTPWIWLQSTQFGSSQAQSNASVSATKMRTVFPNTLTATKPQVSMLAEIAYQYASSQHSAEAVPTLDRARELVEKNSDDCYKSGPLMRVAQGYGLAGETAKGEQLLKQALEIARVQTIANCRLSATSPQESLLNRAAESAEAGQYDWAMSIVEGVNNMYRPVTMTRIARSYWKAQQPEKARQLIERAIALNRGLPDSYLQGQILTVMALDLQQRGAVELLPPVIEQIQITLNAPVPGRSAQAGSDQIFLKLDQQVTLAKLWLSSGNKTRAIALLDQTVSQIQSLKSSSYPTEPIRALTQAAVQYGAAGQPQRAETVMTIALAQAKSIKPAAAKADAIVAVAQGYGELGQTERARSLTPVKGREEVNASIALHNAKNGKIAQAVTIARSLKTRKEMTLSQIVENLIQANQYEQALQIAKEEKIASSLPQVALAFSKAGKPQAALQIAQSIKAKEPGRQAMHLDWLLPAIVTSFAQQGQFDRALQVAQQIKTPIYQSQALTGIAAQYIEADRVVNQSKATETLDQALQVALLIR
jgi:tetratricopeptide (TPR) repeat protein